MMLPQPLWQNTVSKVANKTHVSKRKVEFVVEQNAFQIRKDVQGSVTTIQRELLLLASEYGARGEIPSHILLEAVDFVVEKFGQLSPLEIREAYRAWASGEIEPDGAEIYGGVFNVRQLGKVLSAWDEHRAQIIWEFNKEEQRVLDEKNEAERLKKEAEEFERSFPIDLMEAKKTITDWNAVPFFWYDAIQERWPIKFEPGEANLIFEEAKKIAVAEIDEKVKNAINIFDRICINKKKDSLEESAKSIARKISVFRKVIQNPDFDVQSSGSGE